MSNITHDLLVHGTAAAKSGNKAEAERYFKWLLQLDPTNRELTEAYHWLSDLTDNLSEKRNYLEEILARNTGDARARRKLAILNGDLVSEDIIDSNRFQPDSKKEKIHLSPDSFICPNCSARMVFSPDGSRLECENCGTRKDLSSPNPTPTETTDSSFTVAMATNKGHSIPSQKKIITCRGCSAEFYWEAAELSGGCPYCGNLYADVNSQTKQTITPNAIIPFRVGTNKIRGTLKTWFSTKPQKKVPWVAPPRGFYTPIWLFDVGGMLTWTCRIRSNDHWEEVNDSKVLLQNNIPVSATTHLPEGVQKIIWTYDLSKLISFDVRYLSNWISETYQIALSDASLDARKIVLDRERSAVKAQYKHPIVDLVIDPSSMAVDTYQLILVPIWLTTYRIEQTSFNLAVNGQTGQVIVEYPIEGLSDWIGETITGSD